MEAYKLFMILLGCKPAGRHTEQHDVFFNIGTSIKDLLPSIKDFWPGSGKMHIDGWREVTCIDGHTLTIVASANQQQNDLKLFFLNLGGYKQHEFEEYHYKLITVASSKAAAIDKAKQTAFYKHTGFEGANSHIDDRYGVDVDDIYEIEDILPSYIKDKFRIHIEPSSITKEDELQLGYFKLSSFE